MARKSPEGAVAEKPTRTRKTVEERKAARLARMEARLGKVLINIADLFNLKRLSDAQEDYIVAQVNEHADKLEAKFAERREIYRKLKPDGDEPIRVHMPD